MKKSLLALFLIGFVCVASAAEDSVYDVFKKNGCFVCHSNEKKVVGPAYKDVAEKYRRDPSAEDKLVEKVSKGGSGVWGSMAMPAQDPKGIKQAEIRRLVQYVLRLQ